MHWRSRGALAAVIFAGACAAGLVAQAVAPAADIQLSSRASSVRARVELAARESVDRYSEWLAPPPAGVLTVRDAASWRLVRPAMNVESHVAYDIARQWFGRTDSPAVNAIAWYLQSRVVERLYDYAYQQPGHHGEVVWFFGRTTPLGFELLRHGRYTSVLGRFGNQPQWPDTRAVLPPSVDQDVMLTAMALASLERLAGWPSLQGGLLEARRQSASLALGLDEFGRILSDAMGIHLAAPVLQWYQHADTVDYAIASVDVTGCRVAGCVRTTVRLEPHGEPPPMPLTLRVEFDDGQQAEAMWDARASASLDFESASGVKGVHLDPDRVVLRDGNWLNNDWLPAPETNVPIGKWTARWLVWAQDAVLAYSAGL